MDFPVCGPGVGDPSPKQYNYYLHSIYIALGIISNLEMILSIPEDMCIGYKQILYCLMRDLNIHEFWYL